jgi:hypothetical protein
MKKEKTPIKKPPLPSGKLAKINFSMTQGGLRALEKLEKWKGCKTHAEAFHIIHSLAADPQVWVVIKGEVKDIGGEKVSGFKTRRTFGVNEYTLAGFRKLAKKYDLAVESIIEATLTFIDSVMSMSRVQPFKSRSEALKVIEALMQQANEVRWRLENTFPELGSDYEDPEHPGYHLMNVDAGLDGLYFLVKERLFDI